MIPSSSRKMKKAQQNRSPNPKEKEIKQRRKIYFWIVMRKKVQRSRKNLYKKNQSYKN